MSKYSKCFVCKYYYLKSMLSAGCTKKGSVIAGGCSCFVKKTY